MKIVINGQETEAFGIRGPAGPDGNPVGTVISYLGLTAPKDYLICDGTEYNVSGYPELAAFFKSQFGAANHFGGDGETTFAVPDMRNLFLRGYHGEAEEQLSGEIGQKQETTWIPHIFSGDSIAGVLYSEPENVDSVSGESEKYGYGAGAAKASNTIYTKFSSRPVNMSVLYCIKAVEIPGGSGGGESAGEVYSMEETRIGTWIDGKPIYRRVLQGTITTDENLFAVDGMETMLRCNAFPYIVGEKRYVIPDSRTIIIQRGSNISIVILQQDAYKNFKVDLIVEYTKTTD